MISLPMALSISRLALTCGCCPLPCCPTSISLAVPWSKWAPPTKIMSSYSNGLGARPAASGIQCYSLLPKSTAQPAATKPWPSSCSAAKPPSRNYPSCWRSCAMCSVGSNLTTANVSVRSYSRPRRATNPGSSRLGTAWSMAAYGPALTPPTGSTKRWVGSIISFSCAV